MKSFVQKFEKYLKSDRDAKRLVDRIVKTGCDRAFLVRALEDLTSPGLNRKLRPAGKQMVDSVLTRRKILGLSGRLAKLGSDLAKDLRHPLLVGLSEVKRLRAFAEVLKLEAAALKKLPLPNVGKVFSYKALWSHLPTYSLCVMLNAPKAFSYDDVRNLLWYAEDAQGIQRERSSRRLGREYIRFAKSLPGEFLAFSLPLVREYAKRLGNESAPKTFPVRCP